MLFLQSSRGLSVLAPAKLNLFLRVTARRPDGFHDIESVMTTINCYDTLTFAESSSGSLELEVINAAPRGPQPPIRFETPSGPENLVLRAARLLQERTGCSSGAQITLTKRIPSSAGLGGGSSDCAAALAGLNRFWNLNLSQGELIELAGCLGSDVAFFLGRSPFALCTGRGEKIEPLSVTRSLTFVVAKPASGLSTPAVYRACQPDSVGPGAGEFVSALKGQTVQEVSRLMHNGLQEPAESLNPDVVSLRWLFDRLPFIGHQMSGSGSSYFGVCRSRAQALRAAGRLKAAGVPWVFVAQTCS